MKGWGVLVPGLSPQVDGFDQVVDAGEGSAAEAPGGELCEPSFHQIEP